MPGGSARGRLAIALLLSALAHLLASGGLTWPTAQTPELPGPPIDVVLNAPAPAVPPPTPPPRPRERPPVRPVLHAEPGIPPTGSPTEAATQHAPPETTASQPESTPDAQQPEPVANAPEPVPPHAPALQRPAVPAGFTIRYVVQGSEGGFTLGRLDHIWQSDGARYALSAVAQATGLMRLIYSGLLTQTSFGEITAEGLRPEHYWLQRGRRQLRAHFDWTRLKADLGPDRPAQTLLPGTQDLLSVLYQVSLFPPPAEGRIWVLDGKRLREYGYRELKRETLELPIGKMTTRHLLVAAEGADEAFELWLREAYPQLPVKIRMSGHRQGDAVLLAESIRGLSPVADTD